MSASIFYNSDGSSPEVINNYNAQTGILSSITFVAANSQSINVNDWVNLVITSGGSFAAAAGTSIPASALNGMARVISKEASRKKGDRYEYIRLELNPPKSFLILKAIS